MFAVKTNSIATFYSLPTYVSTQLIPFVLEKYYIKNISQNNMMLCQKFPRHNCDMSRQVATVPELPTAGREFSHGVTYQPTITTLVTTVW